MKIFLSKFTRIIEIKIKTKLKLDHKIHSLTNYKNSIN